jgi:DNA-binding transcriptional LysR family regulator
MKPNQLRVFVAIADAGSLASAAIELHRTQPAVSKTLRELEEFFGLQLFNRAASGMTLTEAGSMLLPRARAVLEELQRGEQDMALLRGKVGGKLCIGASPIAATAIARAVVKFHRQMPGVEVEFHDQSTPTLHDLVAAGRIDAAFCALPSFTSLPAGVHSKLLMSMPMSLATRRKGAYGEVTSLVDLHGATWVYIDPTGAHQRYIAERFQEHGLSAPASSIMCSSATMAMVLASELDVILLLSQQLLRIYESELSELLILAAPPQLELYSLLRPGSVPTRAATIFLECVEETLSDPVPIYRHSKLLLGH